jgi:20S proteasome alpha/beta subunit
MTVCIAATCESGKAIVVAADRMFTYGGLGVEFETDEKKIEQLTPKCVVMAAGNSAYATEILELARRRLDGMMSPTCEQVAELVREEYAAVRARKAWETIVQPAVGSDFARFVNGIPFPTYMEKQSPMYQQFIMLCQQFNLGVDMLIAGIDPGGANLFQVTNPGMIYALQKLGHASIGSGGMHGMLRLSLEKQTRSRDLIDTLASVYSAKRSSEVAPGVGDATDIAIINEHPSGVWYCPPAVVEQLEIAHVAMTGKSTPDLISLREAFDAART